MVKKNPYPNISQEYNTWNLGYSIGEYTENLSDQDIQKYWIEYVLNGDMGYDEFMAWRNGYLTAKGDRVIP